jgi:hypothetical protein
MFTTNQDWVFIIQLLNSYLCTYKTEAVAVQELLWLGLDVASVLRPASLPAQLLFLLQCQSPPTSQDPGCNINKTCQISLCMFVDKRNQHLGSKIHVSTLLVSNPVSRLGAKSVLSISHLTFILHLFLNWPSGSLYNILHVYPFQLCSHPTAFSYIWLLWQQTVTFTNHCAPS